ncbi:MAG: hypothetical protein K2P70_08485 [Hyphomonadaceae bacterium]|nr:hypothetical protein [Hyphomonadaceae bacterium]
MARLSRRKLVAGMSVAPWLSDVRLTRAMAGDPVLVLCGHYADLVRHGEILLRRWSDHEAWLGKNRNWFGLSDVEQKRLPEAQLLYAIDAEYERCTRECARVLRRVRNVPAVTVEGAIAKLSIAAESIEPDDYPSAHRVLLSAIGDLRALQRRG